MTQNGFELIAGRIGRRELKCLAKIGEGGGEQALLIMEFSEAE